MTHVEAPVLPAHVPADLVRDYPLLYGRTTDENPYETMIPKIHEGPAVFYSLKAYPGDQPAWIVRRTEDLRKIYFDSENFSNADPGPFASMIGETWRLLPFESDVPQHGLYRAFVNPIFTPKAMAKLDTRIREYAREYIEGFKPNGSCEFIQDFAFEFPIKIFLELMGLPLDLTKQFLAWETDLLHASDPMVIAAATRNVVEYLRGEIAARKANPTDDLISYGVTAKIEGRGLTDDELVGFAFNLFIGGLDTVSTNMASQFRHLASNLDHQAQLRANPEMIPNAIDECMRAFAAVTTFRTCIKETEICGVKIMPGDKVAMATSLAGRDPEEYDRPNEVILDRKPRHVSWGYGPHMCAGMHLARREMRIAMEEFLAIIPEFRIAPGAKIRFHVGGMIQPESLPLVWTA
jgi:cytochrome P450